MIQPMLKWWIGVVEDRADPEQLGRYRVRVLGFHTANKQTLPTADLPWATTLMPVSSASLSGIGQNPSLIEGSTVVGFFADGDDEQQPVIIGAYMGFPIERIEDENIGFNDPFHKYPLDGEQEGRNKLNEPDTSRLARGKAAETHVSLQNKRSTKTNDVPRAVGSQVPSVGEDISGATYEREMWNEPHPRFGSTDQGTYTTPGDPPTFEDGTTSVYPYNNVTETESGHVFEIDDTPGNGRIHEFHNSGTFYEIQASGDKITKVVGDEYEITLKDKKVYIKGNCDITIGGDAKMYVKGNMYTEVDGHQFNTIRGNRITKIQGNDLLEVLSDSNTQINGSRGVRVSKDDGETIIGNQTHSVGKDKTTTVNGKVRETHLDTMITTVAKTYTMISGENMGLATGADFGASAEGKSTVSSKGVQLFKTGARQDLTATGTFINQNTEIDGTTHSVGDVSTDAGNAPTLATHLHEYTPGSGSPTDTSEPDA